MSFDEFTFYGDTGRWRVAADDEGTVTATALLPGNGIFARDGECVTLGSVHRAWHKPDRYSARSAGWPHHAPAFTCDDYTSARDAASALVTFYDDERADEEGSDD